ncbi:MAG: glycosyltransferase [Verrucomicrobiota bacterium]
MNILFISYAEVSLRKGGVRAAGMLRALADAGHRVDLVAPYTDLPDHPHIRVLIDSGDRPLRQAQDRPVRRAKLRMAGRRAVWRDSYDAVHAADESVFFAMRLCRWKKIPLVYAATRCFSGKAGSGMAGLGRFFPKHLHRLEAKVLERAAVVFSPCSALTADLRGVDRDARVVQLEDIPAQPLYAQQNADKPILSGKEPVLSSSNGPAPGPVVVCCALSGHAVGFRQLLMAARKVIDVVPDAVFFFKGAPQRPAEKMAANLDIADHCVFLPPDEPETFFSALGIADAVLMLPSGESRYIHPQVYTLLHAGAPLVTLPDAAYDEVLTEKTSVRVLPNSESIAEGLLRVVQEPLFSLAVALEGQQLVATRHTYSSFKHKIRMTYLDLAKTAS